MVGEVEAPAFGRRGWLIEAPLLYFGKQIVSPSLRLEIEQQLARVVLEVVEGEEWGELPFFMLWIYCCKRVARRQ